MRRSLVAAVMVAALVGVGAFVTTNAAADESTATAMLRDPRGAYVGFVAFTDSGTVTSVRAVLVRNRYVSPGGFHGFHIHANNDPANGSGCVADSAKPSSTWFVAVDGHYANPGTVHSGHAGDMPSPLVAANGTATLRFTTDRIDPAALRGKAVVLHAGPDNFGNVPTGSALDQYTPNSPAAGEKTHKTGNAGDRVACGILRQRGH